MQIFQSFTSEVVELLRQGAVGVMPTDTVYGLVGLLLNKQAVERMYYVKNRPRTQAIGTILFSDPLQIENFVSSRDLLAAEVYWPGPTSVLLRVDDHLSYARGEFAELPFRIPADSSLQMLLKRTGPLATTSANHPSVPPAVTMEDAMRYFRESVDFYIDGGDLSGRKASRIIKINDDGNIQEIRG